MRADFFLFDLINGLAGRYAWLDAAGRSLAVFGVLAVLLLAVTLLWWPRWEAGARKRYLCALCLAGVACALLFALEWLLTVHLFHMQRARPANARWVTLLITEQSHMAFPAWPALVAFAVALPTCAWSKWPGRVMVALGALLGLSLVFVGVNYPADVLTGVLLGSAIGYTAAGGLIVAPPALLRKRVALVWAVTALWLGIVAVNLRPASAEFDAPIAGTTVATARIAPPTALLPRLRQGAAPAGVTLEAATNGHLRVAWLRVALHEAGATKAEVEAITRRMVDDTFTGWPSLDLLTITVSEKVAGAQGTKTGTLYTATVPRADWPAGGFHPARPLPGRKFFHARFYR